MSATREAVAPRRTYGPRQLGLVVLGFLAVVALAVLVPTARTAYWERQCAEQGGQLTQSAVDTDPLLAPGSRIVYTCVGSDAEVLRTWAW